MKKLQNIVNNYAALILGIGFLLLWETAGYLGWLPQFIIPTPSEIFKALMQEWQTLIYNSAITLYQAMAGLLIGILLAFALDIAMARIPWIRRAFYPYLFVSQTIPTVAIALCRLLLLGYGMTPTIVLIILTSLFPHVINVLEGFAPVDEDTENVLRLIRDNYQQFLRHVKLPAILSYFFCGLKISVS